MQDPQKQHDLKTQQYDKAIRWRLIQKSVARDLSWLAKVDTVGEISDISSRKISKTEESEMKDKIEIYQ